MAGRLHALIEREIVGHVILAGNHFLAAFLAERPHEPLGHHALDGATDQERFDAHVGQPHEGAGGVVGVQGAEHEVAGERRLDGVLGCFEVADFAHQDHVGVVAEDRAEAGREGQSDLGVNLNLVDSIELVFDRVLGRDDLRVFALDLVQGAVERGRFSGTGRARDEDDPVGQADQLLELGVDVVVHADAAERKAHPVLVEDAHHDALAVQHGNDRDADVDLAALDLELDPPVLRDALFGDVQPRHDLQAADDRRLESVDLGRHRLLLEHAVDPVADLHALFLGLDVDVARPVLHGLGENFVDQADDRGLLGHLRGLGMVPFNVVEHLDAGVAILRLGQQSFDRLGSDAQVRFNQLGQLGGQRHDRHHAPPRGRADRVQGVQIERIADRQQQRVAVGPERKHHVPVDQLDGKRFERAQVDLRLGQVNHFHAQRIAYGGKGLLLAVEAELPDNQLQTAVPGLGFPRDLQLASIEDALFSGRVGKNHRSEDCKGLRGIAARSERRRRSDNRRSVMTPKSADRNICDRRALSIGGRGGGGTIFAWRVDGDRACHAKIQMYSNYCNLCGFAVNTNLPHGKFLEEYLNRGICGLLVPPPVISVPRAAETPPKRTRLFPRTAPPTLSRQSHGVLQKCDVPQGGTVDSAARCSHRGGLSIHAAGRIRRDGRPNEEAGAGTPGPRFSFPAPEPRP